MKRSEGLAGESRRLRRGTGTGIATAFLAAAALVVIGTSAAHAQQASRPSRPGGGDGGSRSAPPVRPPVPTRLPDPSPSSRPAVPGQFPGNSGGGFVINRPGVPGDLSGGGNGNGGYRPLPPSSRPSLSPPRINLPERIFPYDPPRVPGYPSVEPSWPQHAPAPPVVVPGPYPGTYQGTGNLSNVLLFPGYHRNHVANVTVVSPFGRFYACPRYIERRYVIVSNWPYLGGREVVSVQPWSDADVYVRADPTRAVELRAALNDLTRFWENGDLRSLRRHLADDEEIGVFHEGRYLYSMQRGEFSLLAMDVLDGIDTLAFRFTDVQRRDDGLVTATARHQYRVRETGEVRTAAVRATLRYRSGAWVLTGIWLASGTPGAWQR